MTVAQRIRALRLMEKMEKAYSNNNQSVTKDDDGTLKYVNDDGETLFAVKMERKERND